MGRSDCGEGCNGGSGSEPEVDGCNVTGFGGGLVVTVGGGGGGEAEGRQFAEGRVGVVARKVDGSSRKKESMEGAGGGWDGGKSGVVM